MNHQNSVTCILTFLLYIYFPPCWWVLRRQHVVKKHQEDSEGQGAGLSSASDVLCVFWASGHLSVSNDSSVTKEGQMKRSFPLDFSDKRQRLIQLPVSITSFWDGFLFVFQKCCLTLGDGKYELFKVVFSFGKPW